MVSKDWIVNWKSSVYSLFARKCKLVPEVAKHGTTTCEKRCALLLMSIAIGAVGLHGSASAHGPHHHGHYYHHASFPNWGIYSGWGGARYGGIGYAGYGYRSFSYSFSSPGLTSYYSNWSPTPVFYAPRVQSYYWHSYSLPVVYSSYTRFYTSPYYCAPAYRYHVRQVPTYRPAWVNPWCTYGYSVSYLGGSSPTAYALLDQNRSTTTALPDSLYHVPSQTIQSPLVNSISLPNGNGEVLEFDAPIPYKRYGATQLVSWKSATETRPVHGPSATGRPESVPAVEAANAVRVFRSKPALQPLTSTSRPWTDSAVTTLDNLVAKGEFSTALQSCEAMSKNGQSLDGVIYLRHAVLKLFTPESESKVEDVLELLNMAAASGSQILPAELNGSTLRDYIASTGIELDHTLDQFSKLAIENTTQDAAVQDSASDRTTSLQSLLLIAALLRLDGQPERASLFADEAYERSLQSGQIQSHSLMNVLRNRR